MKNGQIPHQLEDEHEENDKAPYSLGTHYEDEKDNLASDNKTLWFVLLGLLGVIVALLISNNTLASKTVLSVDIPPKLYDGAGKMDVTDNGGNPLYFKLHGQYFMREAMEFKQDTHKDKMALIESYMTPTRYAYKEVDFMENKAFVESNLISQSLVAVKTLYEPTMKDDIYVVRMDVTVQQKIGNEVEANKDCQYRIALYRQNWKLYILDFNHSCFDDFKGKK